MKKDYRNTIYCPSLESVIPRKKALEKEILKNHPRQKIFYNKIKVKGSVYNKKFLDIYNCKCAYCGNSIKLLDKTIGFEIDHFKNESSFQNNEEASKTINLVLSCYYCNRGKSSLTLDDKYLGILSPDDGSISAVFERDERFNINISERFSSDRNIKVFYENLKLDNEFRRLDFLLLNMSGLIRRIKDTEVKNNLLMAYYILTEKSNSMNKMLSGVKENSKVK